MRQVMARDGEEPGREASPRRVELRGSLPEAEKDLLDCVLCAAGAERVDAPCVDPLGVALVELRERGDIARRHAGRQAFVAIALAEPWRCVERLCGGLHGHSFPSPQ